MKGIGRLFSLGIAKETTRGTAKTSASHWLPFADAVLDEKFENVKQDEAYGIIEDHVAEFRIKNWVEGTIKVPATSESLPTMLLAMFGVDADATHSGETTIYDHTTTVGESAQHQSLTFFLHDPLSGVDYSHALGVIHKMDLDVELKKFVELSLSVKALKGVSQSTFSPSIATENRFLPQYMTFASAPTTAGLVSVFAATGTAASTVHVTALSIPTDKIKVGMTVVGTNIPSGVTVATIVSATAFDLSSASTGNASDLTFGSLAASGTASSTTAVTALSINTNLIKVGMTVTGKYVPAGATVAAIVSASSFTLSAATTGAMAAITFGPAVVQLKSFKLIADASLEDDDVLGATAPIDFLNKEFKMSGTLEAIWQNESDFKTQALATPNAAQALLVSIVNTDVTIGSAANPAIAITLDQVYFTEFSRPIKIKDLVYQTIKFSCSYSTANSEMANIVTTNSTATAV